MSRLFIPFLLCGCVEMPITATQPPPGISNPLTTAPYHQDSWVTDSAPEIDLLLVLDDDPPADLGHDLPHLLEAVLGLDFHLGVISTDLSELGQLREASGARWIDDSTPDPAEVFVELTADLPTGGPNEGIATTLDALTVQAAGWNAGFRRPGANLSVVVISETDDVSASSAVTGLSDELAAQDVSGVAVSFTAIVPDTAVAYQSMDAWIDSDGSDLATAFEDLGVEAIGSSRTYHLSLVPEPGSIEVWIDFDGIRMEFEEYQDFLYDPVENAIEFLQFVPGPQTVVEARYEVAASP